MPPHQFAESVVVFVQQDAGDEIGVGQKRERGRGDHEHDDSMSRGRLTPREPGGRSMRRQAGSPGARALAEGWKMRLHTG